MSALPASLLGACSVPLLLGLGHAQELVSPAYFTAAEADSGNRYPFGDGSAFRYLQLHDDLGTQPLQITGLAFRRDSAGSPSNAGMYGGYSVTLELWLSTSPHDSRSARYRFADNHGNDKLLVVSKKRMPFPPTWPSRLPNPFDYEIKFDRPFAFGGQGSLCWECVVHDNKATQKVYFDSAGFARSNPSLALQDFGRGCRATGRAAELSLSAVSQMNWSQQQGILRLTTQEAPALSVVALLFGFEDQRLGSILLPLLFPGTSNAPSGPCALYVAPLTTHALSTDATGAGSVDWRVFAVPAAHGLQMFVQTLAFDASANAYGLVLSNGLAINWVAPHAQQCVTRVYAKNPAAGTGIATPGGGLVTRFQQ